MKRLRLDDRIQNPAKWLQRVERMAWRGDLSRPKRLFTRGRRRVRQYSAALVAQRKGFVMLRRLDSNQVSGPWPHSASTRPIAFMLCLLSGVSACPLGD